MYNIWGLYSDKILGCFLQISELKFDEASSSKTFGNILGACAM
jgi:hypothetical protein